MVKTKDIRVPNQNYISASQVIADELSDITILKLNSSKEFCTSSKFSKNLPYNYCAYQVKTSSKPGLFYYSEHHGGLYYWLVDASSRGYWIVEERIFGRSSYFYNETGVVNLSGEPKWVDFYPDKGKTAGQAFAEMSEDIIFYTTMTLLPQGLRWKGH